MVKSEYYYSKGGVVDELQRKIYWKQRRFLLFLKDEVIKLFKDKLKIDGSLVQIPVRLSI